MFKIWPSALLCKKWDYHFCTFLFLWVSSKHLGMVSVLVSRSTEGMILRGFSIYRIPLYSLHSLPPIWMSVCTFSIWKGIKRRRVILYGSSFEQKKRNASTKKVTVKSPNSNVLEQSAFSTIVSQVPVGPPILNDSSAV